jgi:hypothetical protein
MDYTFKSHEPWPHIIIDNFLDNYEWHINQVTIWRSMNIANKIAKVPLKDLSSVPLIDQYLNLLPHRPYENFKHDWHYSVQYKGFKYPIHQENSKKILSVVIYIGENGRGTDLYNPDKTHWGEVEWKPNRAFIFSGKEGVTWHSYEVGDNPIRTTLNGFLINDI